MKQKSLRQVIAVLMSMGIAVPVVLQARDKRAHLDSHWRDRQIAIDGDSGDWQGPLMPFDEKLQQPVAVGALNDGEFLYIVLTSIDQEARLQIIRDGLIVWFDPAGGDKKRFGIKYPVGLELSGPGGYGRGRPPEREPRQPPGSGDEPLPRGEDRLQRLQPPNRLEVLGPKKEDARTFALDRAPGIEAKVAQAEGSLVYELKVPLQPTNDFPYAIGAKPGTAIGIGLETPKREMRQRSPGGMSGGRGGFGGGRRGGFGGMGGDRDGDRGGFPQMKPIKGWAVLQLAAAHSEK